MTIAALLILGALPLAVLVLQRSATSPFVAFGVYAFVVPFGSAIPVPGVPGAFGTVSTVAGVAAGAVAAAHLPRRAQRLGRMPRPAPVWALLLGLAFLSISWSIDVPTSVRDGAVLASLVGLYLVVTLLPVEAGDLHAVEMGIVGGGAVAGSLAVYQLATGSLSTVTGIPRFTLIGGGGEVGDPNVTAASLLLPLGIGLHRAFALDRPHLRPWFAGAAALTAVAVLLTGSRGALLGILVVLFTLAWNQRRRRVAIGFTLVPVAALVLAFSAAPGAIQDRLQETGSTGRTEIWRLGVLACPHYCWVGSGWGTFPDVHEQQMLDRADATGDLLGYEAHSIVLQMLVELGIPGLALLVVGLALTAGDLLQLPPASRGPPLAGLAGVTVSNLFLSNLDFKYFWLALTYAALVTARHPGRTATPGPADVDVVRR